MYLTTAIQVPATITAFANIYLAARNNIWNWLLGLIAVTLYAFIFYLTRLYGDMALQGVYFIFQIYGWFQWRFGGKDNTELTVHRMPKPYWLIALFAQILMTSVFYWFLSHHTNSTTPFVDAFTTALSLIAQWMMCKKWLENWSLWILLDLISLYMYSYKGLYLTTVLYAAFIALCMMGYREWKKALILDCHRQ